MSSEICVPVIRTQQRCFVAFSISSDRNHFRPVEQKLLTVCVVVPSCVCRSGPSSLTDDHRTDTQQTLGEPASPTNHCGPHRDVRQPKTRGEPNVSHMRYDRTDVCDVSETVSRLTGHKSDFTLGQLNLMFRPPADVSGPFCFLLEILTHPHRPPARGRPHSAPPPTSSRAPDGRDRR